MKTILFIISAFIQSMFVHSMEVTEVVVERGTNCYTAVLNHSGKIEKEAANLYTLIIRKAEAVFGIDLSFMKWGVAAIGGFALLNGVDFLDAAITVAPVLPIWIKDDKFVELNENERKEHLKTVEDQASYQLAFNTDKMDTLKTEMEDKVGTDVVEALQKAFGELKDEHVAQLQTAMEEQGKELGKLRNEKAKTALLNKTPASFSIELKQVWDERKDDIADYIRNKENKGFAMELKATVARASVANNTMAESVPGVGQVPRRANAIMPLFSTGQIGPDSNGVIRYWDQVTVTSGAAAVAEGGTIPEGTLTWEERTLPVEKIGDSLPVNREALVDVGFVEGEIRNFLFKNIELELDRQLLLGSGASNELDGVDLIAPNYVAGVFALKIVDPSIFDVISTGMVQVMNAGQNGMFIPNAIIMNPEDAELMRLTKDTDGNYIMPAWLSTDGMRVRGVRIIENQLVPQNQLYIGDFTQGTLWNSEGITLDVATQHDTDWIKDITRMKVTSRQVLVIRNVHKAAFLHVPSISASITAITKP